MNSRKIAASLPGPQFESLEKMRRRLGMKRSQVIQEALALWLSTREGDERIRRYLRGYLEQPEDAREGSAYVRAWAQGIEKEDW